MMSPYLFLSIAVVAEISGTALLKATCAFTKLYPSLGVVGCYIVAFYCLARTVQTFPLGATYALWCSGGIILLALVDVFYYHQSPTLFQQIGYACILIGMVALMLGTDTAQTTAP